MYGHKLSQRLAAVAQMVPQGARVADIGSDHAYLPVNLLLNKKIDFAVAGEVAVGPMKNAASEVNKQGFQDRIIVRLADGLAAIEPIDAIDTVVIAGMGGILISKILDAGPRFETLILQPNTDEATVREWLEQHAYQIVAEDIVAEDNHTYELIKAIPGDMTLSAHDKQFGPYLSEIQSDVWRAKWEHELDRKEKVLGFLQAATPVHEDRIAETQAEIATIQEVLK
ncbi:tRNA (adenine(22)-N(1))-methyltransferase TrmK [Periweissella fabaria]|uniref:tRNA (Adenine(22)-N(1))-methyltransferase n=1 Tax=Periweissella fabaria TaxID=546157 RepID=A0ABN8BF85_9LACO|nr:class I SAM-dependent methyltransferase [Periweissella fabaria]MCM0596702.1 tRNA (adenine(22)-N(1))-methyltransferase TrmK [Periweissella fabaria]CAH0416372.1 tRNA (adenine(22)-N(1))-methyltransferase [Periweissella fabaria]